MQREAATMHFPYLPDSAFKDTLGDAQRVPFKRTSDEWRQEHEKNREKPAGLCK